MASQACGNHRAQVLPTSTDDPYEAADHILELVLAQAFYQIAENEVYHENIRAEKAGRKQRLLVARLNKNYGSSGVMLKPYVEPKS